MTADNTQPNIIYDYYSIECKMIKSTPYEINTVYLGQQNRPNITHVENKKKTFYYATQLSILGKIHNISGSMGEIMITHKSSTSSSLLLCYFPISYKNHTHPTDIDNLLSHSENDKVQFYTNIYIDMNEHTTSSDTVHQYRTNNRYGNQCHVIVFREIINIATDITKSLQLTSNSSERLDIQSFKIS